MNPENGDTNKEEIISTGESGVQDNAQQSTSSEVQTMIEDNMPNKKKSKKGIIITIIVIVLLAALAACYLLFGKDLFTKKDNKSKTNKTKVEQKLSPYRIKGNSLEMFDLRFLQLENEEKNKIYSPLSIKTALGMLNEGTDGESHQQIADIIGDYSPKKYDNSKNMSFANALFVQNEFKDSINASYISTLTNKYGAEVIYDSFKTPDNLNSWIGNKTFNLINDLFDDVSDKSFVLVNALAIDMNWNFQIQCATGSKVPCNSYSVYYQHEKYKTDRAYSKSVNTVESEDQFYPLTFNGKENIKSAEIAASFNRYDIVKELGEDKIREEVGAAYKEWLETQEGKNNSPSEWFPSDVNKYLDRYIEEINKNYNKEAKSTDFMLYTDENVKVFAKNLKEYDGTTLQYVGIMPIKEDLGTYVDNVTAEDLNKIIGNLKEMKKENFKDGVVTLIRGRIPMFKYDYTLDLMKDLKTLGVTDVFDASKADLGKMLKNAEGEYISSASHKATIEFSNDGIKAAAATAMGGKGATSGGFDYFFKIPVEEIDLTIDKPFMYIIRDKDSGEVWFMGTVYEGQERSVAKNPYGWYNQEYSKTAWDNYQ